MKTICLANMKGGVGKTSLAVTLAASLARSGESACLLDFDPQGSATAWAAPEEASMTGELADVLSGAAALPAVLLPTGTPGLSLLPTFGIGGGLKPLVENAGELAINKAVKTLLHALSAQFQWAVIDLSPAFGKLERAALISATETITPLLCDRFCIDGLQAIAENLKELQGLVDAPIAAYRRLVINGVDRRIKRHSEITASIKGAAKQTVYILPIDQVFFRAQAASEMIWALEPKPETAAGIERLTADIRRSNP